MKALIRGVAALSLLWTATALAHTHLVRSTPADGAELASAPSEAVLVFARPITMATAKIESTEGFKATLTPPPSAQAEVHLKLPALAPGRYQLNWRAASADGHVMSGHLSFTVGNTPHS